MKSVVSFTCLTGAIDPDEQDYVLTRDGMCAETGMPVPPHVTVGVVFHDGVLTRNQALGMLRIIGALHKGGQPVHVNIAQELQQQLFTKSQPLRAVA